MLDIFSPNGLTATINRINALTPGTQPLWGKMSVDQMLAHLNKAYEMTYEPDKYPKPKGLMKWLLKNVFKKNIVNEKPYPRNMRTAPIFLITGHHNFELEKSRLIQYLQKTKDLGPDYFNGRESHSFGPLSTTEWNNMFAKHLDHHLQQFAV